MKEFLGTLRRSPFRFNQIMNCYENMSWLLMQEQGENAEHKLTWLNCWETNLIPIQPFLSGGVKFCWDCRLILLIVFLLKDSNDACKNLWMWFASIFYDSVILLHKTAILKKNEISLRFRVLLYFLKSIKINFNFYISLRKHFISFLHSLGGLWTHKSYDLWNFFYG